MSRRLAMLLLAMGLAGASCSCGEGDPFRLEPKLELQGGGVGTDPLAEAHYVIDFGMVAVGSSAAPEVFAFNAGNAKLIAQAQDSDTLAPFRLSAGTIELGPKERERLALMLSPREVGAFETTVVFRTNEKEKVKTVRLLGQGIPSDLVCSPAEVHVGDVVRGESRTARATCTNHLSIPTTIRLGDLVGSDQRTFSAELQGGDGTTAEIPAESSIDISIEFHADDISGAATVTLPILDEGGQPLASLSIHANAVEHALQVRYEEGGVRLPLLGCFRFPDTDVEVEEVRSLYVRNLGREPVHIEALGLDRGDEHFSIVSPRLNGPMLVAPNGDSEVEIQLAFHPRTLISHSQTLIIHSDDDLAPVGGVRACVEGLGGGVRISCTPGNIDFGPVAIGTSVTREYTCQNTSLIREGVPPQILHVEEVDSTDPSRFTAEIRNSDGSKGPNPLGYHPNEGFSVLVTYTPGPTESFDSAEIVVANHSSANRKPLTQVVGQGRDLPPCSFDVSPPNLRFGVVPPGTQRTLTSYVINHLDTDCIVSHLRLGDDTDPAFSMDEVESAILPGGERLPITVTFAPADYASSLAGAVEFTISDPSGSDQSIALSGRSREPCLEFLPETIDFGAAPPHCAGREIFVTVANTCTSTLQIDGIHIDEQADGQFILHSVPLLPMVVGAGDRMEFSTYFRPNEEGAFHGNISLEVSDLGDGTQAARDTGPYVYQVKGVGSHETVQTDTFTQQDAGKVDVLWVMDNSRSMGGIQQLIHDNVPAFMQFAVEQGIDFHMGVTSSGVAYAPTTSGSCPGGFGGNEDGRLFPHPDVGRPRVLQPTLPREQLDFHFGQNIKIGSCHVASSMYEAARRALSHPRIHTPEAEGGNLGFLRSEASLSIIGVTNGDDLGSRWEGRASEDRSVDRYVAFFQGLKPSQRKDSVKLHFISGGITGCSGNGGAHACPRCVRGSELTDGVWLEICRNQGWGDALREVAQGAFGFDSVFGLRGQPADRTDDGRVDEKDIEVRVNGRIRQATNAAGARVWRYDAKSNSIAFDVLHVPGGNQVIEVTYEVACVPYD